MDEVCKRAQADQGGDAGGGAVMTIADARENYYVFSGRLSDVVRQLNFAGVAVYWIFRAGEKTGGIPYSDILLWPLGFMISSLSFDMLHYALATLMWGPYARYKEQRIKREEEFEAPRWLNWPALVCIIVKTILCAIGYALLIKYVAGYLITNPSAGPGEAQGVSL